LIGRLKRRSSHGLSRGSRQQANVSRPDGRSALRILANESAARQKTSRRTARPGDRSLRGRMDTRSHPRARSRQASQQARPAGREPTSGPRCRHRKRVRPGPTFCASAICRRPATATHIDDPLASFGPGSVNQYVRDRRKQNVLMLLAIGPVLARRPVPVMRSGRHSDRGLSELPCAQSPKSFFYVIFSSISSKSFFVMKLSDTGAGCDQKQTGLRLSTRDRYPLGVDGEIQYPYLCRIEASKLALAGAVLVVCKTGPGKVAP